MEVANALYAENKISITKSAGNKLIENIADASMFDIEKKRIVDSIVAGGLSDEVARHLDDLLVEYKDSLVSFGKVNNYQMSVHFSRLQT